MGVLGGGGLYSALGARIWSEDVWMVARVGPEFNVDSIAQKGLTYDSTLRSFQETQLGQDLNMLPELL